MQRFLGFQLFDIRFYLHLPKANILLAFQFRSTPELGAWAPDDDLTGFAHVKWVFKFSRPAFSTKLTSQMARQSNFLSAVLVSRFIKFASDLGNSLVIQVLAGGASAGSTLFRAQGDVCPAKAHLHLAVDFVVILLASALAKP